MNLQSEEDGNVLWALLVALQDIGGAYPSAPLLSQIDRVGPKVQQAIHRRRL